MPVLQTLAAAGRVVRELGWHRGMAERTAFEILVVDDEVAALKGLVALLRNAGYRTTGAATFRAARDLLASGLFDLLVTDIRLDHSTGFDLVRLARTSQPTLPVIVITAYDSSDIKSHALDHGAIYLPKPLIVADLLREIEAIATRSSQLA